MKKHTLLLCSLFLFGACIAKNKLQDKSVVTIKSLQNQKQKLDNLIEQQQLKELSFVQLVEAEQPIIYKADELSEEVEMTFTLWQYDTEKTKVVGSYPFSQSGDWTIGYIHYFDEKGRTFAYERYTSFYNSGCTKNIAIETITTYFDTNFKRLSETYTLTDKNKKPLPKDDCDFPYNYPSETYEHLDVLLKKTKLDSLLKP